MNLVAAGSQRLCSRIQLKFQRKKLIINSLILFYRHLHGQFAPSAWTLTLTCSTANLTIESRGTDLTARWQSVSANNAPFDVTVSPLVLGYGSTSGFGAGQMYEPVQYSFDRPRKPPSAS